MNIYEWNGNTMKSIKKETSIKGKRIAITGTLVFYKRKAMFDLIHDLGGIPQKNVTKETDYLVVGYYRKNTIVGGKSNKRIRAERYIQQGANLRIITEEVFLPMLWYSSASPCNEDCSYGSPKPYTSELPAWSIGNTST